MRISPVTNHSNVSYKGHVSQKALDLTKSMSESWLDTAASGNYKTLPIINTCLRASERVNNVLLNLLTIMERFGQACELTYAKSEKTGIHRFFIENRSSNYKLMCGDIEFSPKKNKLGDIDKLEKLEKDMEKLDPYKENSHFIIQRKTDAKSILYDSDFVPSYNYVFLEDKLVGKDSKIEASMEDIKEFLEAAKEEGLIDG